MDHAIRCGESNDGVLEASSEKKKKDRTRATGRTDKSDKSKNQEDQKIRFFLFLNEKHLIIR